MATATLQTAFLTGGSGGIGLELSRLCAASGMNVVLADIDGDRLATAVAAFDRPVLGVTMDVSKPADWDRASQEAEARFGSVDLLVNGAAIPPSLKPLLDIDVAAFEARISTNLNSVFYGVRTFGRAMRARGFGHILNIASEAGLFPIRQLGDYGTAKFGVVGLSGVLRLEVAEAGVGVTVLVPGLTRSNMNTHYGMAASFVAQAAMNGIHRNAPFVITHPSCKAGIERHYAQIFGSIGEPAQPGYENPDTPFQ